MNEEEKLNRLFSIATKIKWIQSERYRNGVLGMLSECQTVEELSVIEHILGTLKYCTSADLEVAATDASSTIENVWNLNPENSILVGLAEPNKTCGSSAYVRAIETNLPRSWAPSIYTNFVSAFRKKNENINLVIVDDFIGTGNKIAKKIKSLKDNPKTQDYIIHVVAFAGMAHGLSYVSDIVMGRLHKKFELKKCISESTPASNVEILTKSMSRLESLIFSNINTYSFGYGKSEAAFFLEAANIPNNNFPILWWENYADNSPRKTLFTRR